MSAAATSGARKKRDAITVRDVQALFEKHFRRLPHGARLPTEVECYSVAVAIDVVRLGKPAKARNDDPAYRRGKAVIASIRNLIQERRSACEPASRDVDELLVVCPAISREEAVSALRDLHSLAALDRFEAALKEAESILAPTHPNAGERSNAAWHKPMRLIAQKIEEALQAAGHKKVSFQKHGAAVNVIAGALKMATGEDHAPETIAAALNKTTN